MTPKEFVMLPAPVSTPLANNAELDLRQCECYLVRVGVLGQVGRFRPAESTEFHRGSRVVCRTQRGIEVGQVLSPSQIPNSAKDLADGRILRRMTSEDELLWGHLERLASQSHEACQQWLKNENIPALLIDVEPLLDGKTLYFHFLSDVSPEVQLHLDSLVDIYEREVRQSKFAQLLEHGCGPGCGTEEAKNGCGSRGGCAVCQVASKCKK